MKIVTVSIFFAPIFNDHFSKIISDADNLNLYDLLGTSLPSSLIADDEDDSDWLRRESFDPRDRILEKLLDSEIDPFGVLFAENDRSESDWPDIWPDKKALPKVDKDFKYINPEHSRSKKRDQERIRKVFKIDPDQKFFEQHDEVLKNFYSNLIDELNQL